jgi:hypothetical protein
MQIWVEPRMMQLLLPYQSEMPPAVACSRFSYARINCIISKKDEIEIENDELSRGGPLISSETKYAAEYYRHLSIT